MNRSINTYDTSKGYYNNNTQSFLPLETTYLTIYEPIV
jgi:hypothetical protein